MTQSPLPKGSIKELLSKRPYLSVEENNTIVVKEGAWLVKGKMIIPQDYHFKIMANTELQFERNGSLVIFGSSSFLGSTEKPVILKGIDDETWQDLVVFMADERSQWSYVNVLNTTGVHFPLWNLTGGVTFYKSNVDIEHSLFSGNRAEDAINIVHSDFTFNKVNIINTVSDGFDGDFVTGSIVGGVFQDIGHQGGGDGVDVSGSNVSLTEAVFDHIDDKAISVGENSTMNISDCKIKDVSIGAASKDKSSLTILNTQITRASKAALMAYVKKPEYGSAFLTASGVSITESNEFVIALDGSYLELNGIPTKTSRLEQWLFLATTRK